MKIIFYIMCIVAITHLNAAATDEQRKTFEKDCNAGQSISCHNMGLMYESGDGVEKDDSKALKFFTQACDKNYYESCSKAAVLYEESLTITQDSKKALALYSKACGGDDAFACHNVAVFYAKNDSKIMKNVALKFYDKACDAGYANSCIYLGRYYRDSKGLMRDYKKAQEKFQIACDLNNRQGCKEVRILQGSEYDYNH